MTLVILFICAKLTSLRLPFYGGAILAVASLRYIEHHQAADFVTDEVLVRLVAALVLFFLLDKAEGKFLRWLAMFGLTFLVLGILL